ncbi:hypothetical protein Pan216_07460 [Planctomycetes bacterium Pan216]|uniref:Uncharacterized protein n=1 Tax=Kolteria novifilia TaxID=2527975 RepID=A0A518AYV8_9BACT|nr:hypothetical protein Pan216_07460 [Planctomycetes bacterium Pan216]
MDSVESYAQFVENMEKNKLALARMLDPARLAKVTEQLDNMHEQLLNGLVQTEVPDLDPAVLEKLQAEERGQEVLDNMDKMREVIKLAKEGKLPKDILQARNLPWVESHEWELFGLEPVGASPEPASRVDFLEFEEWAHSHLVSVEEINRELGPPQAAPPPEQSAEKPAWATSGLGAHSSSVTPPSTPPAAKGEEGAGQEGADSFSRWVDDGSAGKPESADEPKKDVGSGERSFLGWISSILGR